MKKSYIFAFLTEVNCFLVRVFNLVYVDENIVETKLFLTFNLILMLKTKNCIASQKTTISEPIQTTSVWFGLVGTACFFNGCL